MTLAEYIADFTCEKRYIDLFLDPAAPNWATFDPELGYVLKSCSMRDGIDGSYTMGTYLPGGERRTMLYADAPCRINTYGDSFTQCHQVSDAETWQEYLAGHLGEPVRNFGVGGYGVWQAYRRLLRHEERAEQSAEYLIFNIFSDDHLRSIDRWRWIRIRDFRAEIRDVTPHYFHATPWTCLRMDPDTLRFRALPSLCPRREDLYRLCDRDYLYEQFAKDPVVHLEQAKNGGEYDPTILRELADMLELTVDLHDGDSAAQSAALLHNTYALRSTEYILDELKAYCAANGKKLLLILSYSAPDLAAGLRGEPRPDSCLLDYLHNNDLCTVDLIAEHKAEFDTYRLDDAAYLKKYYINGFGHYGPSGNHFCAYRVKDPLVQMLEPRPLPYSERNMVGSATLASRLA